MKGVQKILLILGLIVLLVAPAGYAHASQQPANHQPTGLTSQEEPAGTNGSGAAITMSLLALVLVVVMAIVVIAAVAMGIIGLGYRSVQEED